MATRSRRRLLITLLLGVAIVLVIWRFRGNADEAATTSTTPATGSAAVAKTAPGAVDPATGVPLWLGQRGVGARKIAGVVLLDGVPVPGAVVRLASERTMAGMVAEPKVLADGAGRFDFGPLLATEYLVLAEAPKLTAAIRLIDLRDPTVKPDDLHLLLQPCDASIHGTIRDTSDGVIAGAQVSLASDEQVTRGGSETGEDGTYELCVPVGPAVVVLTADGYAQVSHQVTAFGRVRRDFSLVPEAAVNGRVVRESDQTPVAGAVIELVPTFETARSFFPLKAWSDADGNFSFEGAAPGRHTLVAAADGYATSRPVDVLSEIGRPSEAIVVPLAPTVRVLGKVMDRAAKTPVAGTEVRLVRRNVRERERELSAVSQSDGNFVIENVLPSDYDVFGGAEPPPTVSVTTVDVANVVLEVDAVSSISGRVTHGGKPIAGAELHADQTAFATSEHDGRYRLQVAPGSYRIYAESKRLGVFTRGPSVTVAKGESKPNITIEMDLSGSIAGTVVDQNDTPIAGASLRFSLLRGEDFGRATTADDGTFSARGLSGGGDYVYEVRQGGESSLALPPATGKRHPPITVRDGQTHVMGVRIKIRRERLSITGRVVDASGTPIGDVSVTATPAERYMQAPTSITTEAGTFAFRDLPAGAYDLRARAPRGEARVSRIAAGQTDVVLTLSGAGGIDGTLANFTDKPDVLVERADDGGSGRYHATITGDTFRVRDLPAGRYEVSVISKTGYDAATVTVTPDATAKVALRPRGQGTITGVVVNKTTREPLPDLRCMLYARTDRWSNERRLPAVTDAKGAFRIERVIAGDTYVACDGKDSFASGEVSVVAGQTARLDLEAFVSRSDAPVLDLGLGIEVQLGEVMVKSLVPGGIAQRGGLAVGDVIIEVNDRTVGEYTLMMLESNMTGTSLKFDIERADKPMTITLALPAKP